MFYNSSTSYSKNSIKGLKHMEEITQSFDIDYYDCGDEDDDFDGNQSQLFRAYQDKPITFPNGIKLTTWKERALDKDGKEMSKEEYKIKLSYNKFSDKDKNIQFITKTISLWIDEYKAWKKKIKILINISSVMIQLKNIL